MPDIRRTVTVAILATLGAIAFAFSVVALTWDLSDSIGADNARAIGVTYTFDNQRCVGETAEFRECRWTGTIRDGDEVLATNVKYADTLPPDLTVGTQINALWSSLNPTEAWSIETTRAWLNSIAALLISGVMFVALTATAFVSWRRLGTRHSKSDDKPKTKNAESNPSELSRSTS
jgi:hypothetical protein